jgi:hypothetical protein
VCERPNGHHLLLQQQRPGLVVSGKSLANPPSPPPVWTPAGQWKTDGSSPLILDKDVAIPTEKKN